MQTRSEETRLKILTAAQDLFGKAGYDATGVSEICAGAGVSKGAFYHHFPSKQAVFSAILDVWLERLNNRMLSARLAENNVPDGLVAMAGQTNAIFRISKDHYALFFEFWMQAIRHPEIWQAAIAPYQHFQEIIAGVLQSGISEGSIDPSINPADGAHVLVALALGLLLQAFFDPHGAAWEEITGQGVHMLLTGISRRPI
jgi:AcrR family transcriptional regulator